MADDEETKREKHRLYMRKWYAEHPGYRKTPEARAQAAKSARVRRAVNPEKYQYKNFSDEKKARIIRASSDWRKRNWQRHLANARGSKRRQHYGITVDQYEQLTQWQDGRCAICREIPKQWRGHYQLHVDHNHASGKVRGLLCVHCNMGLGQFYEDKTRLTAAIDYIDQHAE